MNDRARAEREETEEIHPKGYYRQAAPYDPFVPTAEAPDEEEGGHSQRLRRRKSRKSWRSIRPRPTPGETKDIDRSLWVGAGCLILGFVLGFALRPLLLPAHGHRVSVPDEAHLPAALPNQKLDERTEQTRQAIRSLNQEVQEKALRQSVEPMPVERLEIKPVQPRPNEEEGLLKLQPAPLPL